MAEPKGPIVAVDAIVFIFPPISSFAHQARYVQINYERVKNWCNLVKLVKILALFGYNIQGEIGFQNCSISGSPETLMNSYIFGKVLSIF